MTSIEISRSRVWQVISRKRLKSRRREEYNASEPDMGIDDQPAAISAPAA